MIKRIVFVALFALYGTIAHAEAINLPDLLAKLPALKQGVAWSLQDSKLNHISTIDVAGWKGINLEIGAAYDAENTGIKAVAVLSYDLLKLKDIVNLPILNLVEFRPGVWAGLGRIEGFEDSHLQGEGDWGLSLSVINVRF